MKKAIYVFYIILISSQIALSQNDETMKNNNQDDFEVKKSDEEWKSLLTPLQYRITREKGTERAFTGEFYNHFEKGTYYCIGCNAELFQSEMKYESHCGWPSFFDTKTVQNIKFNEDTSHGMIRTEVVCAKCGAHLGHIFNDGPDPTGKRFCINSASLRFEPEKPNKTK